MKTPPSTVFSVFSPRPSPPSSCSKRFYGWSTRNSYYLVPLYLTILGILVAVLLKGDLLITTKLLIGTSFFTMTSLFIAPLILERMRKCKRECSPPTPSSSQNGDPFYVPLERVSQPSHSLPLKPEELAVKERADRQIRKIIRRFHWHAFAHRPLPRYGIIASPGIFWFNFTYQEDKSKEETLFTLAISRGLSQEWAIDWVESSPNSPMLKEILKKEHIFEDENASSPKGSTLLLHFLESLIEGARKPLFSLLKN